MQETTNLQSSVRYCLPITSDKPESNSSAMIGWRAVARTINALCDAGFVITKIGSDYDYDVPLDDRTNPFAHGFLNFEVPHELARHLGAKHGKGSISFDTRPSKVGKCGAVQVEIISNLLSDDPTRIKSAQLCKNVEEVDQIMKPLFECSRARPTSPHQGIGS